MRSVPVWVISILACATLPAQAVELSEALVNRHVAAKFPKYVSGLKISDPALTLRDGDVLFCANATSQLLPEKVDFCASLVPEWHQSSGALRGRQMQLVSIVAPGLPEKYAVMGRNWINAAVLPALDGAEVYQTDSWIGRQVAAVRVVPGKVDLQF